MEILIVTGGSIQPAYLKNYLKNKHYDHIIAADAGLSYCQELKLMPTEILGDFDSLSSKELLLDYQKKEIPVLTFPTRKDFTDTHLAILHAKDLVEQQKNQEHTITILGGMGTRMDHSLANIGLLSMFADLGVTGQIIDEKNTVTMLKGPCKRTFIKSKERKYLSILACSEEVTGVTLEGFDYPLQNATLHEFDSLGISNEILNDKGIVTMETGYLLVIQAED